MQNHIYIKIERQINIWVKLIIEFDYTVNFSTLDVIEFGHLSSYLGHSSSISNTFILIVVFILLIIDQ